MKLSLKVEEWKKHKSKEVEISKSPCDGDADDSDSEASIPQRESGKGGNQHFGRKDNEELDSSGRALYMKKVRKKKKEKWTSKESKMTPVLEEANLLTSDLLQRNDNCRLSEGRPAKKTSHEKNKGETHIHSQDHLEDLTWSSEMASEDQLLPAFNPKACALLIEQLAMHCKGELEHHSGV
ncbi:ankyrin repeat domain-containing protein 26 [Otolemur garnettii]|uniref:ankyrin repeat domain-containing protein 26 n=1 Tax=Otolemur garnettii TaxID=30611 RepID=UPI000C7EC262|nr:ankyrin repeat domain-containing protein 26 [Otolemur garnettii]